MQFEANWCICGLWGGPDTSGLHCSENYLVTIRWKLRNRNRKDLSIRCIVVFVVSSEMVGCGGVFFAVFLLFIYLRACMLMFLWKTQKNLRTQNTKKHYKNLWKPPELIWKDGFSLAAIVKISASFWGNFQRSPQLFQPLRRCFSVKRQKCCMASTQLSTGTAAGRWWLNCHYWVECYFHHQE